MQRIAAWRPAAWHHHHRSAHLPLPPSAVAPRPADSIINPEAPLALRLSGQLLLGLVRLYLRRLQFLEEDAGLALRGLARVRGRLPAAGLPPPSCSAHRRLATCPGGAAVRL